MKKVYRLKKNHEIASIVLKRQRVSSEHFVVYFLSNKEEDLENEINAKVAISVSKKYGKAFERNKAKRQVREIVRPSLSLLKNKKVVIVVKTNSKDVKFDILKEELLILMKRISKKGEQKWIKK